MQNEKLMTALQFVRRYKNFSEFLTKQMRDSINNVKMC